MVSTMSGPKELAKLLKTVDTSIRVREQDKEEVERQLETLREVRANVAKVILGHAAEPNHKNGYGTKVALLKTILQESTGPLHVNQVIEEMTKRGYPKEKKANVYSTLYYLRKNGMVKLDNGYWSPTT